MTGFFAITILLLLLHLRHTLPPDCFSYRIQHTFSTSTFSGSNDVQLIIDTASIIDSGVISDCSTFRFRQENSGSWLTYWWETSCYSSTARVWVSPTFSNAPITVEVFYGCFDSAGATDTPSGTYGSPIAWSGRFVEMVGDGQSTSECGPSWSDITTLVAGRYLKLITGPSSLPLQTNDTNAWFDHSHTTTSLMDPAPQAQTEDPRTYTYSWSVIGEHVHSMSLLDLTSYANTEIPPYRDLKFCRGDYLDYHIGSVILTESVSFHPSYDPTPQFTRYGSQDGKLIRAGSSFDSGGHAEHIHFISGTLPAPDVSYHLRFIDATDNINARIYHEHDIEDVNSTAVSNLPTHREMIIVQIQSELNSSVFGNEEISSLLHLIAGDLPPKGFEVVGSIQDLDFYPFGSVSGSVVVNGSPTSESVRHNATIVQASYTPDTITCAGSTRPCSKAAHTHPPSLYRTDEDHITPELIPHVTVNVGTYNEDYRMDGVSVASIETFECAGVFWQMADVCTGNGTCNGTHCDCNLGYSGDDCSILRMCFDFAFFETGAVCSGNGMCSAEDYCVCDEKHYGDNCQHRFSCFGISGDNASVCYSRGECRLANDTCFCEVGYSGPECELSLCGIYWSNETDAVCSGVGNCTDYGVCECEYGFENDVCQDKVKCSLFAFDTPFVCRGRGECVAKDTCDCDPPYSGIECEKGGCENASAVGGSVCSDRGICFSEDLCLCRTYRSWGRSCAELIPEETVSLLLDRDRLKQYAVSGFSFSVLYEALVSDILEMQSLTGIVEVDTKFNCSSRLLSDSIDVIGSDAVCEWIRSEENEMKTRSVEITVYQVWNYEGRESLIFNILKPLDSSDQAEVKLEHFFVVKPLIEDTSLDAGTVAAIVVPLLIVFFVLVAVSIVSVLGFVALCKRVKKFNQLEDFDILLKEQEAAKDTSVPHLKISSAAFEISWEEIKLEKLIGKGGSDASIFLARYRDSEVAIKIFKTTQFGQQTFAEFEREVEILSSLLHPHILNFFGAVLHQSRVGIVMEYCLNGDMTCFFDAEQMKRGAMYPLREKLRMFREIASAMSYIHGRSVLHRDIKPENVLVTKSEETRMVDFGLSKVIAGASSLVHTQRIGTSVYMAPEVYLGQNYSTACDLYSFTLLVYVSLTENSDPYCVEGASVESKVAFDPLFRPYVQGIEILDRVPWLIPYLVQGWSADPSNRPSASDFVKVLSDHITDLELSDTQALAVDGKGPLSLEETAETSVDELAFREEDVTSENYQSLLEEVKSLREVKKENEWLRSCLNQAYYYHSYDNAEHQSLRDVSSDVALGEVVE